MEKLVNIRKAAEELKAGKTILYPTDTVWGLGCDAKNEEAIQKIKAIKNRSPQKSFILLVENVAMLERYVPDFPDVCYDIIDFAIRPTTIIYDQPKGIPSSLLAGDGSIGIRVTKDRNCQQLIQKVRGPIVSTSANLSGEETPNCFENIDSKIKEEVDFILEDKLQEEMATPSSVIKIGNNSRVKVIR